MNPTIAGQLVKSARRYRGLSGRELARRARASQAGLVEVERGPKDATTQRLDRLLRPLGYQVTVLPTRLGTAAQAAEEVATYLEAGDADSAQRVLWQLSADLAAADPALRVALAVTPAAPTGDPRYDALLAGIVDHALSADRLPAPAGWTSLAGCWQSRGMPSPSLRCVPRHGPPRPRRSPRTASTWTPLSW
jgi:transcriptional regulator with XRE-family HTH domain